MGEKGRSAASGRLAVQYGVISVQRVQYGVLPVQQGVPPGSDGESFERVSRRRGFPSRLLRPEPPSPVPL